MIFAVAASGSDGLLPKDESSVYKYVVSTARADQCTDDGELVSAQPAMLMGNAEPSRAERASDVAHDLAVALT